MRESRWTDECEPDFSRRCIRVRICRTKSVGRRTLRVLSVAIRQWRRKRQRMLDHLRTRLWGPRLLQGYLQRGTLPIRSSIYRSLLDTVSTRVSIFGIATKEKETYALNNALERSIQHANFCKALSAAVRVPTHFFHDFASLLWGAHPLFLLGA